VNGRFLRLANAAMGCPESLGTSGLGTSTLTDGQWRVWGDGLLSLDGQGEYQRATYPTVDMLQYFLLRRVARCGTTIESNGNALSIRRSTRVAFKIHSDEKLVKSGFIVQAEEIRIELDVLQSALVFRVSAVEPIQCV
jgi:hypothetical protein